MGRRRGTVTQRSSGAWYAIVSVVDTTGKRLRPRRGPFATRAEAWAALAEMNAEVAANRFVIPSGQPVGAYLRSWLDGRRHDVRPSTFAGYQGSLDRYVLPAIGRLPLSDVGPQHIRSLYLSMTDRGLAARTVRAVHVVLRMAFEAAVADGLLSKSPVATAKPPRVPQTERTVWGPGELGAFLAYVRDHASPMVHAAIHTAAASGVRRGELLGLRWDDVDLDAAVLHIRQTRLSVGGRQVEGPPKTQRSRRTVAVDAATVAILRQWKLQQAPGHDRPFTVEPNTLSKKFRSLVIGAGLPDCRLHDLRHCHASLALAAGVTIPTLSARLGHSTAAVTLGVYAHSLPGADSDAADRVAALMAGSVPVSAPAGS